MTKDQRRIAELEDKVARLQKHCLELQHENSELRHAQKPDKWIPDGWKLVPVKPTGLMQVSAKESLWIPHKGYPITRIDVQKIWSAMVNIAPTPPEGSE